MIYEVKSTGLRSPRRRRTERDAVAILNQSKLRGSRRKHALMRIRRAKQPVVEARRIVDSFSRILTKPKAEIAPIDGDAQLDRLHDHRSRRNLLKKEQRKAYQDLLDRICAGNITDEELDALLKQI